MDFSSILPIIASTLNIAVTEVPIVEVIPVRETQIDDLCGRDGVAACFVGRGDEMTVYITHEKKDDLVMVAHEYTHAVQYALGMFDDYACHAESEFAAYRVANEVARTSAYRERVRKSGYTYDILSENQISRLAACD